MSEALLPILSKLEWIHESCDPEYKKQKEDAYYGQWRKSIVCTDLWYGIYKGFQQARNELIRMVYDSSMDALRLLNIKRRDLSDAEAVFATQHRRLNEWSMDKRRRESWAADYDMASHDVRYFARQVKHAESEVRYFDRQRIHVSMVTVDLGENGYCLVAPMLSDEYCSFHGKRREIFYTVEEVFRHFYDRHVKDEE